MDIGQVGFKDEKKVRYMKRVSKDKEILKAILKTQEEPKVDLKAERERRDREQIKKRKEENRQQRLQEAEEARKKEVKLSRHLLNAIGFYFSSFH
ncbi:ccdc25 protein [Cystoisospora suis]|uniref:Ccdc25 protein n=1 Tax=Cystoisospora suis TaxID=483139 RepID=A0A2C6LHF7_9APIC|nr:ccdc25 protein [Cystoisospora suis]